MKPRNSHKGRHQRSIFTPRCVFAGFGGVVCLAFAASVVSYRQLQASNNVRAAAANPFSPEALYGSSSLPGSSSAEGPSQLLLLSYYNSRASLVARLLMLMGIFAGEAHELRIDEMNRLRWWELKQVTSLNDLMLRKYSAAGLPAHLARGFHRSSMSTEDTDYYTDRVEGVIRHMNQHQPWLLKDPRLSWLAIPWLEQMEQPLCMLVVQLQPLLLAKQLAAHAAVQGGETEVSSSTHVERWTNATLSSLRSCFAVPTIVVPSSVLEPPLLQPFMAVLQQHLKLAGVQGTTLPTHDLLQQQYISHLEHTGSGSSSSSSGGWCDGSSTANTSLDGAAMLRETCNWLPPPPSKSDGDSRLPLPTIALIQALRDHLQQSFGNESPQAGVDYTKVAGQIYSAYTRNVKQLVQDQDGHATGGLHHSIAALIHDAMHHVSLELSSINALLRQ